jgi:hypothetical protein
MKGKEKPTSASRNKSVGRESRVLAEPKRKQELDQQIARSLATSSRQLTDIPFNFRGIEVLNASIKRDRLVLTVQTLLSLPEPSGNSGEYLGTWKQLEEFCRGFEEHLRRNMSAKSRRTLSNILHSEFDAFVRTIIRVKNQDVMSYIPKTTERRGAGHPRMDLHRETVASLEARSAAIKPALREIRKEIARWKAANSRFEDDTQCKDRIRNAYSDRFDWIPIFLEIKWGDKCTFRKAERVVRISDLSSWSAANRADLIALEEHRIRTQQSVSLSKFQHRKLELRVDCGPSSQPSTR